jgi:predicted permease
VVVVIAVVVVVVVAAVVVVGIPVRGLLHLLLTIFKVIFMFCFHFLHIVTISQLVKNKRRFSLVQERYPLYDMRS